MANKYENDFRDSTKTYINSLSDAKYDPIPKEIEDDLFNKLNNGDNHAYKQLIESHLRLVVNIAKQFKGCGVEMGDLISEGKIGLITAIQRFDPKKGARLCSYAPWWIMKSIRDLINSDDENNVLFSTMEKENTLNELDKNFHDTSDNNEEISDSYIYESEDTKEHYIEIVNNLLDKLDDRSKFIIEYYYGINGKEMLSINEISKMLNISTERVRQIKSRAMLSLRSQALIQNVSSSFN